jgi:hypothetical protein
MPVSKSVARKERAPKKDNSRVRRVYHHPARLPDEQVRAASVSLLPRDRRIGDHHLLLLRLRLLPLNVGCGRWPIEDNRANLHTLQDQRPRLPPPSDPDPRWDRWDHRGRESSAQKDHQPARLPDEQVRAASIIRPPLDQRVGDHHLLLLLRLLLLLNLHPCPIKDNRTHLQTLQPGRERTFPLQDQQPRLPPPSEAEMWCPR